METLKLIAHAPTALKPFELICVCVCVFVSAYLSGAFELPTICVHHPFIWIHERFSFSLSLTLFLCVFWFLFFGSLFESYRMYHLQLHTKEC